MLHIVSRRAWGGAFKFTLLRVGRTCAGLRSAGATVLSAGKHKGLTFEQCEEKHPDYCNWVLKREKKLKDDSTKVFACWLRSRLEATPPETSASVTSPDAPTTTPPAASACNTLPTDLPATEDGRDAFGEVSTGIPSVQDISSQSNVDATPHSSAAVSATSASVSAVTGEVVVAFGKYRGLSFSEAFAKDPRYCDWVRSQASDPEASENLKDFAKFLADAKKRQTSESSDRSVTARDDPADIDMPVAWEETPHMDAFTELPHGVADAWGVVDQEYGVSSTSPPPSAQAQATSDTIVFGKYKGLSFAEALAKDPRYCFWIKKESAKEDAGENLKAFAAFIKSEAAVGGATEQEEKKASPGASTDGPTIASGELLLGFGKHQNLTFEQVYATDLQYCDWLARTVLDDKGKANAKMVKFAVYILHRRTLGAASVGAQVH